jgi:hypothetical protein
VCFSAYGERKSGTSRRVFWKGGEEREGNIRGRGRGREGGTTGCSKNKRIEEKQERQRGRQMSWCLGYQQRDHTVTLTYLSILSSDDIILLSDDPELLMCSVFVGRKIVIKLLALTLTRLN